MPLETNSRKENKSQRDKIQPDANVDTKYHCISTEKVILNLDCVATILISNRK